LLFVELFSGLVDRNIGADGAKALAGALKTNKTLATLDLGSTFLSALVC